MVEDGYESLYLRNQEVRLYSKPVETIETNTNTSTFKTFVVSYSIGSYRYESEVRTSSSQAAILWAENFGATNITILPC